VQAFPVRISRETDPLPIEGQNVSLVWGGEQTTKLSCWGEKRGRLHSFLADELTERQRHIPISRHVADAAAMKWLRVVGFPGSRLG
jgi:hypothetical protein